MLVVLHSMTRRRRGRCTAAKERLMTACESVLTERFWEHARASRREATAAFKTAGRLVRRRVGGLAAKEPAGRQKIDIA